MNVAFITSVVAAEPNQTQREVGVLGQRNDIYISCKF